MRICAIEYAALLLNKSQKEDNMTGVKCTGENHIDENRHHSEMLSCTSRYEDRWDTRFYRGLVERSNLLLVGTTSDMF